MNNLELAVFHLESAFKIVHEEFLKSEDEQWAEMGESVSNIIGARRAIKKEIAKRDENVIKR